MDILQLENVSLGYKDTLVLEGLNLNFKERSITTLLGDSGSGKSTLLSSLNGFLEEAGGFRQGSILLKGRDIKELPVTQLRQEVATLFQYAKPFPFSIKKNLLYPMNYYGSDVSIEELLMEVNLWEEVKDDLNKDARLLSGGQQQRLCIARLLTLRPSVLIFDEPCSSLDARNRANVERIIKQLAQRYTIIMTTHQEDQAYRLSDQLLLIEDKRIQTLELKKA